MIEIALPYPPSVNHYIHHNRRGQAFLTKVARDYKVECARRFAAIAPRKFVGKVRVHAVVNPPDNRKRDLDNLWKMILDSVTAAELWADDYQACDLRIIRGVVVRGGLIVLTVENME